MAGALGPHRRWCHIFRGLSEITVLTPTHETREIDDGPVYTLGLHDELSTDFFAGLVTSDSEAGEFDLRAVPQQADRTFIQATDY
jgi:hypothetical protein